MYVQTPIPLPAGNRAFFTLQLPPNNPMRFHLEGKVVWSNRRKRGRSTSPKGMGIRFVATRAQSQKTLDSILSVLNTLKS
jgi:Tfp pilus assembly protein PilZ